MVRDDDEFRQVADGFRAAALEGSWGDALCLLARATGSPFGQLIGVGSEATVPFNWITDFDPAGIEEWLAINGADPRLNARVRAGLHAPELAVLCEADFATEADLKGPVYDLYRRYGIDQSCQSTLVRQGASAVGLAVLRSGRQGPLDVEQRRAFAAITPHASAAIRLHMALELQGAALVTGAFEVTGAAAFVCDARGRVCALSAAGESLVSGQRHLSLADGRLRALNAQDAKRLDAAITEAASQWRPHPVGREITVRAQSGGGPLHLHVAPLPQREYAFRFQATVLVVARAPRDHAGRLPQLQAQFGLTDAEAQIALALARGRTLGQIADERGVSIGTLRSQLKSIFGKVGVRRQAELAARLNEH